jgi:hypothetical protein
VASTFSKRCWRKSCAVSKGARQDAGAAFANCHLKPGELLVGERQPKYGSRGLRESITL